MSHRMLNIGGDPDDFSYHYKMSGLQTKIEGKDNSHNTTKTILINVDDVSKSLCTEPAYITKFFGIELSTKSQYDKKRNIGIIQGSHQKEQLQSMLNKFIHEFILCSKCKLPELKYRIHELKNVLLQKCSACGWKGSNSSTHKIKRFILTHPFNNACNMIHATSKNFLRACKNFKTIEENGELLLCGYIRENACVENKHLYNMMPLDIIHLIFIVCYTRNNKYFQEIKDTFDVDHINEWNKYKQIFELNQTENILRMTTDCMNPQIAYGLYIINHKLIRKVWRIKVLKNNSKNKAFSFKICIIECDCDKPITYEFIANDTVTDDDGFYYYSNIKEEDIISILFINYNTTKSKNVLIQFAINDVIYPKKFDIKNMQLRCTKYRLAVKMTQMEVLQLLQ
eukprot:153656_1